MPFRVIDAMSKTDDWRAVFLDRVDISLNSEWRWCPGSYTTFPNGAKVCGECGQPDSGTWRTSRREVNLHLTRPIIAGLYVLDVGRYDLADGARCLKIGCSRNIFRRLREHFKNSSHDRCTVLHCLPCPGDYQLGEALECLLSYELERQGAKPIPGASSRKYDYYLWRDELADFCRRFLVPELVSDILTTLERRTKAAMSHVKTQ